MVNVLIRLKDQGILPFKAHLEDAAYDLFASECVMIPARGTAIVPLGFYLEIPNGWKGEVYSRSGLASKGIQVANSPGKIDSGYRGEMKVILYNSTEYDYVVNVQDKIAQLEINPVHEVTFVKVENLSESPRGSNGFGSTGARF